jgi:primase-polymerase (primpol)-like protein
MFANVPREMQQLRNWVNWKYEERDGKQTKVPILSIDGRNASVTNPLDWSTFDTAVRRVTVDIGLGFVFTKTAGICGIDFDRIASNTIAQAYYQNTHSYAEYSPSGQGVHILCVASLPGSGKRRNGIEVYDTARFFTITGNLVDPSSYNRITLQNCQTEVEAIYSELSKDEKNDDSLKIWELGREPQSQDDAVIVRQAMSARNNIKFGALWHGDWQMHYGNQSQSEADFALIDMLTFYSKNREQVARLFRASGLGQRDKAKRDAYVHGMINRSFDRAPKSLTPDALDREYNKRIEVLTKLGLYNGQ